MIETKTPVAGKVPLGSAARLSRLTAAWPVGGVAGATILWVVATRDIDVRRMTDLGLVSVLPPLAFLALLVLTGSFCLTLRQRPLRAPILALHLAALVFMVSGIAALVEEVPRPGVTWVIAGFTEFVMRTGNVAPLLDARFNWPGFFVFSALLAQVAGLPSATSFLAWAPLVFDLLYLGPLVLIFRAITSDKRLVWLGAWFFCLTNWVGQDYFSPQALTYFLYLVILGILLKWFREPAAISHVWLTRLHGLAWAGRLMSMVGWLTPTEVPNARSRPGQRAGLMAIVATLFAAVVPSHQLTPFFLLSGVTALVVFNRCSARSLPVLMAVLIGTWIGYMTIPYLQGHFGSIVGNVGRVGSTVDENVTGRLQGSPEHEVVVRLRIVMALALWGIALLGGLRRLHNGYRDLPCALLAAVPFPLLGLQSYDGEMLLRVYLFALPFMVFFAAALFYTAPDMGTSWRTTVGIGLVSGLLLVSCFITRYGNERFEYFTAGEIDAVRYLYRTAEPGSLVLAGNSNIPWQFQDVERYNYEFLLSPQGIKVDPNTHPDTIADLIANKKYPAAYLILTRSEEAYAESFYGMPPETWQRLEGGLMASGRFQLVFTNTDAKVFVLVPRGERTAP